MYVFIHLEHIEAIEITTGPEVKTGVTIYENVQMLLLEEEDKPLCTCDYVEDSGARSNVRKGKETSPRVNTELRAGITEEKKSGMYSESIQEVTEKVIERGRDSELNPNTTGDINKIREYSYSNEEKNASTEDSELKQKTTEEEKENGEYPVRKYPGSSGEIKEDKNKILKGQKEENENPRQKFFASMVGEDPSPSCGKGTKST